MNPSQPFPNPAKFGLIGVIFHPNNVSMPWLVQDSRKALKNEYPCSTKGNVLETIATILDDMHHPPSKLQQDHEHAEIIVAVTLKASLCDLADEVDTLDLRRAASQAVKNAVRHHEPEGFIHFLADKVVLGVREVKPMTVE